MLQTSSLTVLSPHQSGQARGAAAKARKALDEVAQRAQALDQKEGVDHAPEGDKVELRDYSSFSEKLGRALTFRGTEGKGLSGTAEFAQAEPQSIRFQKPTNNPFRPERFLFEKLDDGSRVYSAPQKAGGSTVVRENSDGTLFILQDSITPEIDFQEFCEREVHSLKGTKARTVPEPERSAPEQPVLLEPEAVKAEPKAAEKTSAPKASSPEETPVSETPVEIPAHVQQAGYVLAQKLGRKGAIFGSDSRPGLKLSLSEKSLHLEGQIVGPHSLWALEMLQRDGQGGFEYGGVPVEMSKQMRAAIHHTKSFGVVGWGNG